MPNWVSVVVVIVVVLAAGLLYESWRMRDLERVASRRGLALHRPLGAHEKLTTCAHLELTTPKTGSATWRGGGLATSSAPQARRSSVSVAVLCGIIIPRRMPRGVAA